MRASAATGLLTSFVVIVSVIIALELSFGGGLRWLPAIACAVILAPILLIVTAEMGRRRG